MPISGFLFAGPPVDEGDIAALERELGVALPPAYRAFLLRTNGGRPDPEEAFPFGPDQPDGSLLGLFYHVTSDDTSGTIAYSYRSLQGRVPPEFLPVGYDAGGSQVCIGIEGKRYGKVYFWSMEDEADDEWFESGRPYYRNIWEIAEDFDEFLEGFHEPSSPDDDQDDDDQDDDDELWPRTVSTRGTAIPISDFYSAGPPVDEADLAALERELGMTLPPEYRAFLLRINGGRPEPEDAFPLGPDRPVGRMDRFFHVEDASPPGPDRRGSELMGALFPVKQRPDENSIVSVRKGFEGLVPPEFLPVGEDAVCSLVCIGIEGERYGRVYYWNKEGEVYDSEPYYGNIWKIAEDFDEFLAGFHECPPVDDDDLDGDD